MGTWGHSFTKFIKLESVPLYLWQISENDSISNQQLEIGFNKPWKLCLNLRSGKWLWTSFSLVINSISLGLWLLKALLTDGVINLRILFLKILRQFEFLKFRSRLFHLVMPDRTKYFLKNLCCFIERNILNTSREYWELLTETNLKRYCRDSFL